MPLVIQFILLFSLAFQSYVLTAITLFIIFHQQAMSAVIMTAVCYGCKMEKIEEKYMLIPLLVIDSFLAHILLFPTSITSLCSPDSLFDVFATILSSI